MSTANDSFTTVSAERSKSRAPISPCSISNSSNTDAGKYAGIPVLPA